MPTSSPPSSPSARLALLGLLLLPAACSRGRPAAEGDRVRLHYKLTGAGVEPQGTEPGPPAEAVLGQRQLPPGVEAALLGLRAGQGKTVELAPGLAFGAWEPALVKSVPLKSLPGPVKEGDAVHGLLAGKPAQARVLSVSGDRAELDFNHPLAGKTLRFELRLVSVEAP